jgi:AcrR family transcriptional regulator
VANRTRPQRAARNPGTPVRQDDGRWNELLEIAGATFAERGYQSTTLQDIADQFGVLKGSLYHYIRSKDDLLYEVIQAVFTGGLDNLRTLAAADLDPAARLRAIIRGHVLYLIENLVGTTVLLHEFEQLSPERRTTLPVHEYQSVVSDLISDAQRVGAVKSDIDPHLAALAVLGATNWVYRWYREDGGRSASEIADRFAEMLTSGLLVDVP